jgi:hypothetical protein
VLEAVHAEYERRHGWTLQLCRVETAFAHNDTACTYFGARPLDGSTTTTSSAVVEPTPCAVPASIALATHIAEPPACHGSTPVDERLGAEVAYWRSLAERAEVECYVPTSRARTVTLDACAASTAAGHSATAAVWRVWLERLVYLTRTPREGAEAIERIAALRTRAAGALVVGALLLCAVDAACVYCCCRLPSVRTLARRRRAHRAAEHKMY